MTIIENSLDSPESALKRILDDRRKDSGNGLQIPESEFLHFSRGFVRRRYPAKQTLIRAGEIWDKVFFIHRGIIRLFYVGASGREFNKGLFLEGQFLWPVAPSARVENSLFTIATLEAVEASVWGFEPFCRWLNRQGIWEHFALPHAEALAEEKFTREYEFLMHTPQERYLTFCKENPVLAERLPAYHLASYLGMTDVSLSRIKSRIKNTSN
ncbi:Crp/Fnr family transcriptional regulator [Desulfospira joergensenii]|uniref:Crp/Fnr family transcriptional regulator n=1 Tax=Desulfospira joergensenii TaxID=53329 RepID=UPI0003B52C0D|nr:Crp/Fnr family transcriptional regulator [Desulfospira joergensenii]